MLYRRYFFIALFLSLLQAQSLYNAVGLGLERGYDNAPSLGVGSLGLLPTFSENLSLGNPATWSSGNFALLTGGYGSEMVRWPTGNINNDHSSLNNLKFILPIKGVYSWGLEIAPVTSLDYLLQSVTDTTLLGGDTLAACYEIDGVGGINSFNTSVTFPLTEHEQNALTLSLLFGSARHSTRLSLDDIDYVYSRHDVYSGINLKYYLTSDRLKIGTFPANLFFAVGWTLKPLKLRSTQYHIYEDTNDNGYYDSGNDFPYMSTSEKQIDTSYTKIRAPLSVAAGIDLTVFELTHLQAEYGYKTYNSELPAELMVLYNNDYKSIRHFNLGAIKFARPIPREWYQHFHYRIGVFHDSRVLLHYSEPLVENGIALGIGFKFGVTANQLDLAYSLGQREGPLTTAGEQIQRFSMQITLGDLWFVKRRTR